MEPRKFLARRPCENRKHRVFQIPELLKSIQSSKVAYFSASWLDHVLVTSFGFPGRRDPMLPLEVVACGHAGMDYVLDTLKLFIAEERQLLQLAADNNDEVTVAMMSDYLKEQEKLSWMLTAFSFKKEEA